VMTDLRRGGVTSRPTGEQEQDGVLPAVGGLDPLGAQAAVRVLGRRHEQTASSGAHAAAGQEVVFDEAHVHTVYIHICT